MTLPDYGNIIAYKQWAKEANDNELEIEYFGKVLYAAIKGAFQDYPMNSARRWPVIFKAFSLAYESLSMVINLSPHDEEILLDEMREALEANEEPDFTALKQCVSSYLYVFESRMRKSA